jgi:hypothetical protein
MQAHKTVILVAILLGVAVTALFIYFFVIPEKMDDAESSQPDAKEAQTHIDTQKLDLQAPGTPATAPPLLTLNESDGTVRQYLEACSINPDFLTRITEKDLIRTFVAAVDNIANGESPANHLKSFQPKEPFKTIENDKRITVDPGSYDRYNQMVDIFLSLDTKKVAQIYTTLKPLFDEAFAELGYPGDKFEDRLWEAVVTVLSTPIPSAPVLLNKKLISYEFANPRLESLNPAQKHLLRVGPENTRRIQKKLRAIVRDLNIWDKKNLKQQSNLQVDKSEESVSSLGEGR